jgi:hypothetical protein
MGLFGVRANGQSQSPPRTPVEAGTRSSGPPSPTSLFKFIPLNESASAESLPEYHMTVDLIQREHFIAANSSIRDPEILKELKDEIERDCDWLRNFLLAAKVYCASSYFPFRYLTTVTAYLDFYPTLSRLLMKYLPDRGIISSAWEKNWLVNL